MFSKTTPNSTVATMAGFFEQAQLVARRDASKERAFLRKTFTGQEKGAAPKDRPILIQHQTNQRE
jgi:ABC-type Fe2+-enterobactin transport system substrate-binding protein